MLKRVKISRLSVDYAIVERSRLELAGRIPANQQATELAKARYESFATTLRASQVTRLHEGAPLDKEAYLQDLGKALGLKP